MVNAGYFESSNVLERRVVCMDALRDSLYEYLSDDHVKIEERSAVDAPQMRGTSVVASSVVREDDEQSVPPRAASPPRDASSSPVEDHRNEIDDVDTRVVSHVFEGSQSASVPPSDSHARNEDEASSIGPDDSVSCADFAEKQHRELKQLRSRIQPSIPEDEQLSHTSLSLSSVSITQHGPVPKKKPPSDASSTASSQRSATDRRFRKMQPAKSSHDAPFDEDECSELSSANKEEEETLSEASMARAQRSSARRQKSPTRSYVTSLSEHSYEG